MSLLTAATASPLRYWRIDSLARIVRFWDRTQKWLSARSTIIMRRAADIGNFEVFDADRAEISLKWLVRRAFWKRITDRIHER